MNMRLMVVSGLIVLGGGTAALLLTNNASAPEGPTEGADKVAQPEAPRDVHAMLADINAGLQANTALTELNELAAVQADVRSQVLRPWAKAFEARDAAAFGKIADGATWSTAPAVTTRTLDGITEARWSLASGAGDAAGYLAEFTAVDSADLQVVDIETSGDSAKVAVKYDLRGRTADGGRRHDRGDLALTVAKKDGSWKLTGVAGKDLERLTSTRAPSYEDITAKAHLADVPVLTRTEAIRRGGYALAVSDYDGDLDPDIVLGSAGPMQFFRNNGGTFEDVTKQIGLGGETYVKSAAFVDLDNDKHKDLVLMRFVEDKSDGGDTLVYRNKGDGTFELKANVITASREYDRAMPLAAADFDGNGYIDLYLGFPGTRDFTNSLNHSPRNPELAEQGLWLNKGDWNFDEATDHAKLLSGGKPVYPHSTLVTDLNSDGAQDLIVIDDSGQQSPVYLNDGKGVFTEVGSKAGVTTSGFGMSAAAGDYDGDGDIDLAVTQIAFSEAAWIKSALGRATHPALVKLREALDGYLVGNQLYKNNGDGTFTRNTEAAGTALEGDATAGLHFVDYNHDGHLDLYVVNGLWSGADGGEQDISSTFVRMMLNRDMQRAAGGEDMVDSGMAPPMAKGKAANPMLTLVREFKGDIRNPAAGATSDKPTLSFGGFERNRLLRNNGDGTFTEVGYLEGADRIEDGYVIAAADYDQDGRQDLLLRHCDPAPGVKFVPVTMLRNTRTDRNAVTVYPRGSVSNADGIGTVMTAFVGDQRSVREVQATAGAVQGEPVAYFGLGEAAKVDRLEVRWPNGKTEVFDNVKAGRFMVEEGKGMTELVGL